ncbi:MAG: carboxypeptidase regulatory-like domain-containing protein, partial [Bacteroidota bacterium]
MLRYLSATLLLLLPLSLLAQYGEIKGLLTDDTNGEPLPGAAVVTTTGKGAYTDDEGNFTIGGLTRGTYTLVFRYVGFQTDTLTGIEVKPNQTTTVNFKMLPKDVAVEGTEIVTKRANIESSNMSMVSSIKLSETLDVGISKEQIMNSQDRTAAQVMRRVPGVSLANGRFVMVRGLSPRYSQVLLNGALTPSVELDVRSFSFDIIPSSLIEEITVTKVPVPHLPGDFAGGMVQIKTLDIPERDITQVSYKNSWRVGTTLMEGFKGDTQYTSDLLGDGSADRALPENFPADLGADGLTRLDRIEQGASLPNTWAPQDLAAIPDQRASLLFSRAFG